MERQKEAARLLLWCVLGIALCSCAAGPSLTASRPEPTPYPPPGYAHMVQSSHVAIYWNCARPEPGVVQLGGLAFNPWSSQPVRFLEVELVGVDSRERTVSAAGAKAPDIEIHTNQSTPFQTTLRTTGGETRFDLYYRYLFQDGGRDGLIAGLGWDGPVRLANSQKQFRVLDACSESRHRAR